MTKDLILQIISFIDLTTLNAKDTAESVSKLIAKAEQGIEGQKPAAICVFPNFATIADQHTNLPIAVVAGGFPLGQTFTASKVHEVEMARLSPAAEIDIVINRGHVTSEKI